MRKSHVVMAGFAMLAASAVAMAGPAGGTVSGIEGDDDPLKSGNLVCGNEFIHAELVKILKPLGK